MAICGVIIVCGLTAGTWYYVTPKYTRVGYQPIQPVPFPHDVHVSQLGMDCRYCHSFVDVAAHSNLPNTQTCMNCHSQVQKDNPKLEPVRASWKTDDVKPAEFVAKYGQPQDATEDLSKKKKLTQTEIGQTLKERWNINPTTNCQGCHR